MSVRSPGNWAEIISNKNAYQIATFLLEDLIGYRSTSLHRADDADNLANLITAIRQQVQKP